jgi:hypothetical protein
MTSSGIESATFRLATQCINQWVGVVSGEKGSSLLPKVVCCVEYFYDKESRPFTGKEVPLQA